MKKRPCEDTARRHCLQAKKRTLTRAWSCLHPDLGLPASSTMRKCIWVKVTRFYGILLWQLKLANKIANPWWVRSVCPALFWGETCSHSSITHTSPMREALWLLSCHRLWKWVTKVLSNSPIFVYLVKHRAGIWVYKSQKLMKNSLMCLSFVFKQIN